MILLVYLGFYVFGLAIARWLTLPQQALVSGIATILAAAVASLTLWLLARTGMTDPGVSIAMIATIALPALMIGLGLLAGWALRKSYSAGGSTLALTGVVTIGLPIGLAAALFIL